MSDDFFSAARLAREAVRRQFGELFLINYEDSTDGFVCFDTRASPSDSFLRLLVPVLDGEPLAFGFLFEVQRKSGKFAFLCCGALRKFD